jgi:hypothetical protein
VLGQHHVRAPLEDPQVADHSPGVLPRYGAPIRSNTAVAWAAIVPDSFKTPGTSVPSVHI